MGRIHPGLGPLTYFATLVLCLEAFGCAGKDNGTLSPPPPPPPPPPLALRLQSVATGLSFPVYVTAPAGDARLFIVEKSGHIRVIKNGQLLAQPFLDIANAVSGGNEQGLLGLAFHPGFASNGVFVVDYTDLNGDTRVATYHANPGADVADAGSARVILTVAQPYSNHNGGDVVFGPDAMLYIGMGDGGSGGDPQGHGQNPNDLLGSLLRVQVNADGSMSLPADNPVADHSGWRPEVWSIGLRNPWRFTFDRANGNLYIADVGQNAHEEVDVSTSASGRGRAANYGWAIREGTACYPSGNSCTSNGFVAPVLDYTHVDGCSITGGFVYRGAAIPALQGTYFYADYCSGWVRSFTYANGAAGSLTNWPALAPGGSITSFGEDAAGELYVLTQEGGVWKIVPGS